MVKMTQSDGHEVHIGLFTEKKIVMVNLKAFFNVFNCPYYVN